MENKKCGNASCACSQEPSKSELVNNNEIKLDDTKNLTNDYEDKNLKKDPTRFGDWEINGRAIDF
jgi:hypothetical protein